MENKDETSMTGLHEWRCSYCPSVATTIRQGSAVCYHHAAQFRIKVGLAKRILSGLRTELSTTRLSRSTATTTALFTTTMESEAKHEPLSR